MGGGGGGGGGDGERRGGGGGRVEGKERGEERQEGEEQYGVTGWLLNVNPPRTLTECEAIEEFYLMHMQPKKPFLTHGVHGRSRLPPRGR